MGKYIAVVSGGLDSTTLVYDLRASGHEVHCVSFNYAQRHKKELDFAIETSSRLGLQHTIIDLSESGLTGVFANSGSSLVDNFVPVPDGHYAEESMKQTIVPNRNMIMLAIAAGIGVSVGAERVATGVHAGDHFIYPDCRPDFIQAAHEAIVYGNDGSTPPMGGVFAPYLHKTKEDIAFRALELKVPLELTWSCYKGGELHCGTCGTCTERLEAIDGASRRFDPEAYHDGLRYDKTQYVDSTSWKATIEKGAQG